MSEQKLTDKQLNMLIRASRPPVELAMVERKGGAIFRMLDRMQEAGLVTGPPYKITAKGKTALDAVKTWCPFCRRNHAGGYKCMGHHP